MNGTIESSVYLAFADEYKQALADFVLGGAGEAALMRAYQLGRRAVSEQRSILDLAALHQHAMLTAVLRKVPEGTEGDHLATGEAFFAEVMAPFEMMHRGYIDTIRQLKEVNETLEQRVDERAHALQESERRTARLARLYAILSGINSAIVRLRNRDELFHEACRIAVDQGGFSIAWIGMRETDQSVTPTVWRSRRRDGRDRDRSSIDKILGWSQEAIALILEKSSAMIRQLPAGGIPTRQPAPNGHRAYALLPLMLSKQVIGVFALHAADAASFDQEEMRLLNELAGDLSFALDHIKKEEQLAYFAYYDALTGLPNSNLLLERLARQIQTTQGDGTLVAVLLADLLRFSSINDTYGRHIGDHLLKQVSERLKQATEQRDTVARVGADRFAIMLTQLADADQVAHKLESELLSSFSQPFRVGDSEIHLSVRVGISLYPADAASAETLLKNAEIALKRAKREGEHYLVYDPTMNERIVRTVTLEAKLRKALERDQLIVHYQPKVDSDSARIVGLEALVRYADPDLGLIPPTQFIPLLEETGMIIDVGAWVMRRAAADYLHWRGQGLKPPRIAVNVSPIQMRRKDFVRSLKAIAHSVANDGIGLDIEITESAVMEEVEHNIPKLDAAREMGFHIAIDDFGTGYSSLSYLTKLPVNALKIDRSFIVTMAESPSSLAIVTSIISLAHSLRLEVIAEGVELEEQAKLLRLLRCEQIQGHLFSHAMPAEQIAELLSKS